MEVMEAMQVMQVVVAGTMSTGKSTFIRSISEIDVVDIDKVATDETALLKDKTTIAFDVGRIQFGPDSVLHLYGTLGQERFDFIWDFLTQKAQAYILLVAAHRPHEFRNARCILNYLTLRSHNLPMIVGVTHTDYEGAWDLENVAIALGFIDRNLPPIITVNAHESESVANALLYLVHHYIQIHDALQTELVSAAY